MPAWIAIPNCRALILPSTIALGFLLYVLVIRQPVTTVPLANDFRLNQMGSVDIKSFARSQESPSEVFLSGPRDQSSLQHDLWADVAPHCQFHDSVDGLFEPGTPHPRYIITGGAGFIGSSLVRRLQKDLGPGQIKVIDNLWRGNLRNLRFDDGSWAIRPTVDFCHGDLRDPRVAEKLLRGADTVYHLADIVAGVGYVFGNQESVFRDNLLINTHALKAAKSNGIRNFVYVGTACSFPVHLQMGPGIHALREDQTYPAEPESSYGWSKLMGEYEAGLARDDDFHVGILRFHNVYGRRSDYRPVSGQAIPSLIRKAIEATDDELNVWGSGKQYRDFVHIDDVVEALLLVEKHGLDRGVIQIGSGEATTIADLAHTVAAAAKQVLNKELKVVFDESMPEGDRGRIAVLDRARTILGWTPKVAFANGIADLFAWVRESIAKTRVLVIEIGNQRGSEYAWKSMHRHLLRPYDADLAIFVTESAPRSILNEMAQYEWKLPEYGSDWSPVFDRAASVCRPSEHVHDWHKFCQLKSQFMGSLPPCTHPASSGILWSYRWLVQQHLLEQHLLEKYDFFVMTRTDHVYLCDHYPFTSLRRDVGYVSAGEGYGGYTDRHLVGSADMFMKMINVTNELVCDTDRIYDVLGTEIDFNMERVQKVVWEHRKFPIAEIPRSMLTVRAKDDMSRWSQGEETPSLADLNLKVKYPGELQLSKEYCAVDDYLFADYVHKLKGYSWQ